MKVEKLAKNREKGQNCYPLSPVGSGGTSGRARVAIIRRSKIIRPALRLRTKSARERIFHDMLALG